MNIPAQVEEWYGDMPPELPGLSEAQVGDYVGVGEDEEGKKVIEYKRLSVGPQLPSLEGAEVGDYVGVGEDGEGQKVLEYKELNVGPQLPALTGGNIGDYVGIEDDGEGQKSLAYLSRDYLMICTPNGASDKTATQINDALNKQIPIILNVGGKTYILGSASMISTGVRLRFYSVSCTEAGHIYCFERVVNLNAVDNTVTIGSETSYTGNNIYTADLAGTNTSGTLSDTQYSALHAMRQSAYLRGGGNIAYDGHIHRCITGGKTYPCDYQCIYLENATTAVLSTITVQSNKTYTVVKHNFSVT